MKTENNRLRNWLASGLAAGYLAACGSPPLERVEVYHGNLPGYGETELTTYTNRETGILSHVEFQAAVNRNHKTYSLSDSNQDGTFDVGLGPESFRLYRGDIRFASLEDAIQAALAERGKTLIRQE